MRATARPWTTHGRACALLALSTTAALLTSCGRDETPSEPPLRPLLYTEAPAGAETVIPGYEEWMDPEIDPVAWPTRFATRSAPESSATPAPALTPDALVLEAFAAMTSGDEARLGPLLFDPPALAVASRMGAEAADAAAAEIRAETLRTMELLAPRSGARRTTLRPRQVTVGRGRSVDGALVESEEEAVMRWGSELAFHVSGVPVEFTLRFPNVLVDEAGRWKLRAAPVPDERYERFRIMGLDLSAEMMGAQHAPLPLSVGNYWHYRVRDPESDMPEGAPRNGFRDTVVEVDDHNWYRVARIRRVYDDPAKASERYALLVSPLRVHECGGECVRRARDLDWVLSWARQQTAVLEAPLGFGTSWGSGSRAVRVGEEPAVVDVPAGIYDRAIVLTQGSGGAEEQAWFVPGIGFVARQSRIRGTLRRVELTDYRILP